MSRYSNRYSITVFPQQERQCHRKKPQIGISSAAYAKVYIMFFQGTRYNPFEKNVAKGECSPNPSLHCYLRRMCPNIGNFYRNIFPLQTKTNVNPITHNFTYDHFLNSQLKLFASYTTRHINIANLEGKTLNEDTIYVL